MNEPRRVSGRRLAVPAGAAALLAPLNSTMIAVALPSIRDEFDVGVVAVSWLVTLYLVAVAIAQPVGGRLGDAIGSLSLLRIGLLGMAALSVVAALAPSFEWLVAARSLQGIAAAVLIPSATAYLRKSVSLDELPGVLGTNGAMISTGAALGPVVGGLTLAVGGWQWLFYLNLPVIGVVWLLLMPMPRDEGRGASTFRLSPASLGALIVAFSGLALLGSALRSDSPWFAVLAAGLGVAGIASYGALFRKTGGGVLDLNLFGKLTFARAGSMTALSNLVMYTTLVAMPVYLRDEHDVGTGVIGLLLFAMSATNVLAAPAGGVVATRLGIRVGLVSGSLVLTAAAAGVLTVVAAGGTYLLAVPLAFMGVGMGLGMAAQQSSGLGAWAASMAGSAAGTLSFMRYVGSVAGASLLAGVLGGTPGLGAYEALLAILLGIAVINGLLPWIDTEAGAAEDIEAPAARSPSSGES
jgi:MFS family permease